MKKLIYIAALIAFIPGVALAQNAMAGAQAAPAASPTVNLDTVYVSKEDALKIQQALQAKGYYKGRIDGVWGAETGTALASFQRESRLQGNGALNDATLAGLGVQVGAPGGQGAMQATASANVNGMANARMPAIPSGSANFHSTVDSDASNVAADTGFTDNVNRTGSENLANIFGITTGQHFSRQTGPGASASVTSSTSLNSSSSLNGGASPGAVSSQSGVSYYSGNINNSNAGVSGSAATTQSGSNNASTGLSAHIGSSGDMGGSPGGY